ncbi:hypothetical protein F5Y16DRAFT_399769 [Xylariaceae sp. FL0255]|nr:hypothetical protein F5Y16DRAFT_399769 [Xylariaceae sp. FL0255]
MKSLTILIPLLGPIIVAVSADVETPSAESMIPSTATAAATTFSTATSIATAQVSALDENNTGAEDLLRYTLVCNDPAQRVICINYYDTECDIDGVLTSEVLWDCDWPNCWCEGRPVWTCGSSGCHWVYP